MEVSWQVKAKITFVGANYASLNSEHVTIYSFQKNFDKVLCGQAGMWARVLYIIINMGEKVLSE